MPKKLNLELLQKLVAQGKLKQETLDSIPNYAEGGIVETLDLVPNYKTSQVPSVQDIQGTLEAQGRMPRHVMPGIANGFDNGGADASSSAADQLAEGFANSPSDVMTPAAPSSPASMIPESEAMVDGYEPEARLASEVQNLEQSGRSPQGADPVGLMEAGLLANMQANGQEARATVDGLKKTQDILMKQQEIENRLNIERQLKLDEQQAKVDLAAQDYMQGKIDPNRIWADKSTGQRLGMAAALFLSGINGSNAGAQILNNAIDRDLDAQKAQLNAKKGGFDMQRTMLSDMMNRFGDERQAMAAAKLTQIQMAELQVKSQLAKAQGTRGYAEGLQGMAKLQGMKIAAAKQFQMATLLSPDHKNQMDFAQAYMNVPEKMQDQVVKLPGNKLGIATSAQTAKETAAKLQAFDNMDSQLSQLEKLTSFKVLPSKEKAEAETLLSFLVGNIKDAKQLGTLDRGVADLVQMTLGDPNSLFSGQSLAKVKKAREQFSAERDRVLSQNIVNYKPLNLKRVK